MIKKNNRILTAVLALSAVGAFSMFTSEAAAYTTDPSLSYQTGAAADNYSGYGYSTGTIPVQTYNEVGKEIGNTIIHDSDIMRYDKNRSRMESDYYQYEQNRYYGDSVSPVNDTRTYPDGNNSYNQPEPQQQPGEKIFRGTVQDDINATGIYINSIEVSPSQVLTKEEINSIVGPYVGRNVLVSDIQAAINALNNLYAEKGFVTARAYLPEQTVSNGNLRIELIESKIGSITVVNNKYTRSNYILDRMPQKEGDLFDIVNLEQDVLNFNRYHDGVNLAANLKAGTVPGTTDIELTAQETFPFHIIGMMDNAGRRSTGQLRGGPAIVADSLFHSRDQMMLGAYFSKGSQSPFFDYSYPINKKDGRIGFSFSSTFAKVINGEYDWMGLKSNSYLYSLYYDQPIVRKRGFEFKTFASLNYKRSFSRSNLGDMLSEIYQEPIADPIRDTDQITSIMVGANIRKDTKYGIWYFNQNVEAAVPIFDSQSSYFKIAGGALRLHDFSHGIIGQLRGSYQVIPNSKHIPYLDQFQVGGLNTVRGYSEGVTIGKNGYFISGELIFPLGPRYLTRKDGRTRRFIGHYIKGAVFADTAGIFPYSGEDYYNGSYFLASIGMGLRVQLPGDLSARLYWGYPLINNAYEQHRHMGRFHFELTLEPDLGALLSKRNKPEPAPAPAPAPEPEPEPEPLPPLDNNYDDIRHYDYLLDGASNTL